MKVALGFAVIGLLDYLLLVAVKLLVKWLLSVGRVWRSGIQ
jgi:hypothetical protein